MNEFKLEIIRLYDLWIYNLEKRSASYSELAYIQNLTKKELNYFYKELIDELEKMEVDF